MNIDQIVLGRLYQTHMFAFRSFDRWVWVGKGEFYWDQVHSFLESLYSSIVL